MCKLPSSHTSTCAPSYIHAFTVPPTHSSSHLPPHPFTSPPIHPSPTHPSIRHPSIIHPSTHPSPIHLPIHLSIYPPVHHTSTHPLIHPSSTHASIYLSIHPDILYPSLCPSIICPPIHGPTQQLTHSFIHPGIFTLFLKQSCCVLRLGTQICRMWYIHIMK